MAPQHYPVTRRLALLEATAPPRPTTTPRLSTSLNRQTWYVFTYELKL